MAESSIFPPMKTVKTISRICLLYRSFHLIFLVTLTTIGANAQPVFKGLRENLGLTINNTADQIAPFFSPDGLHMYYAQNSSPDDYYEIWHATMDSMQNGLTASRKASLRSSYLFNQTVFGAFANDWFLINGRFPLVNGQRVYEKGFSWYQATSPSFDPAQAIPLNIEGIEPLLKGGFANIFFHPGKKVLLLSLANPDKRDLFISYPVNSSQWPVTQWKKPVPLPAVINTGFEESCPFLDESGRVLYFSSNRPGGYGGDDIYVSYALSEDLQQWSPAKNLGFSVNSNFSELYFTTYANHPFSYFVSYKHSMGAGDIFRIRTPDSIPIPDLITRSDEPLPEAKTQFNSLDTINSVAQTLLVPSVKPGQLPVDEYLPNNIIMLLDKSVSMSQNSRFDLLRKSAQLLLNRLRYLDKVSLVTFGEKATLAYSTNSLQTPDSLLQIIQQLKPDEAETFLNDGLQKAVAQSLDLFIESGNNEILVITDGYFSISSRTMELLARHPQIKITFVLVDAGRIEANIKDYISKQLPASSILLLTNDAKDLEALLNNVKAHSRIRN